MMRACDRVDLYGVESEPGDPYHYYGFEESTVYKLSKAAKAMSKRMCVFAVCACGRVCVCDVLTRAIR